MGGRFIWASCSDFIGRKPTYMIFFALGMVLYFLLPLHRHPAHGSALCWSSYSSPASLISMYGGGFATIPAYLPRYVRAAYNVSAIHGRLLTAWSVAGIVGPLIVNGILDHYIAMHIPRRAGCIPKLILHIMAGLQGSSASRANLMVRPVAEKYRFATKTPSTKHRIRSTAQHDYRRHR